MKKTGNFRIADGNEAVAAVAFRLSEIISIYPITPSSPMAEFCDEWAAEGQKNLWGDVPQISEMQSEAGVAGAVHGALQCGSMVTTFTASQGLLLMLPNLFKIAGELTPFCMHVTARAIASHALSIFGDHSDVMACRTTGFALLASNSVQEASDFAAIATATTLRSRIPFLHFFDGFRTSHEINTYQPLADDILRQLIDPAALEAFRTHGLTPDAPVIRGTAQNPDVFFQGREASNRFYQRTPAIFREVLEKFAALTGRRYGLFDYVGAENPAIVFVIMGSGAETIDETIAHLNENGAALGLIKVRLYRPFDAQALASVLPISTQQLIVLDRTKEPGALGEPLYLDISAAIHEARQQGWLPKDFLPRIDGGRYGLGSKEFSPAMVNGIVEAARKNQLPMHFTVGIEDDVTSLSVPYDFPCELPSEKKIFEALFFGLGADGTVGANKNSIKIIGRETDFFAQAYFVYDSKKSGAVTVSHLRFGPEPIHAPYLITSAQFLGCHQFSFLEQFDLLRSMARGGVFLLNSPYGVEEIQRHLPRSVQERILELNLQFYVIDAYRVAAESAMGNRINTIMQTCFFAISGIIPQQEAVAAIRRSIQKTYGLKGQSIVEKNFAAVDATVANLFRVQLDPEKVRDGGACAESVCGMAPPFIAQVTAPLLRNLGEFLPVSKMPVDGTWPTATSCWEKRNIAYEVPAWDLAICIQCNKCSLVCPHAAIRAKFYPADALKNAPATFKSADFRSQKYAASKFTIQVAPEDCTGCGLCVKNCPARDRKNGEKRALSMVLRTEVLENERKNFEFFRALPNPPADAMTPDVKGSQFRQPLFEFSGACSGCGETPYIKLLTQLFGDHLLLANATGCSSIYSGNLPTTPYCTNEFGRGPAWANSLFEDNAEFGMGMLLAQEQRQSAAQRLLRENSEALGESFVQEVLQADQSTQLGIEKQRERVAVLRERLASSSHPAAMLLRDVCDSLVKKSVWILGGDGWAYDIGFGGLDHILASGKNVKILVLDTEVYSNTGGQQSKSTPRGAIAKFAAAGKSGAKKNLGRMAMTYGHVYVAQVAMGAKDSQTVNAFLEAESYDGPALIVAYSPCIAHGYELRDQLQHQRLAVESGYWNLYRFDPRRRAIGKNPLLLDSKAPSAEIATFMESENRFNLLKRTHPDRAKFLAATAQSDAVERYHSYEEDAEKKDSSC